MRAVIQRVKQASVIVDGAEVSRIGRGLLVLVGISKDDGKEDMEYIMRKVLRSRLWDNDKGVSWRNSVEDLDYEILCVSQFTLYGHVKKGNKPDFHGSMGAAGAKVMYDELLERLRGEYKADKIKDGVFQAMMDVSLVNDGPVTLLVESPYSMKDSSTGKGGAS
eukprot:Nk52_evm1s641 gene=Nk52_evmTU1s641